MTPSSSIQGFSIIAILLGLVFFVPLAQALEFTAPDVLDLRGKVIAASDGRSAPDIVSSGRAVAEEGGRGEDLILRAPVILVEGAILKAGDGGMGGSAVAKGPGPQVAIAGNGGDGGRILFVGEVIGSATMEQGAGGDGGTARAIVKGQEGQSCTGGKGNDKEDETPNAATGNAMDATATATNGDCGPRGGVGGAGGDAYARGGNGGVGTGSNGGHGGSAYALAGRGGPGQDACYDSFDAALAANFLKAGNGGPGGFATAIGGDGGPGLVGGNGGSASTLTEGGPGGNGTELVLGPNNPYGLPDWHGLWGHGGGGPEGLAEAGDGGIGVLVGGGGGGAAGGILGGAGGSGCNVLYAPGLKPTIGIPFPSPAIPLVVLLVAVCLRRFE